MTKTVLDEPRKVEVWRYDRVVALGYRPETVVLIAASPIDVHELARLIEAGATRLQAYRILSPL